MPFCSKLPRLLCTQSVIVRFIAVAAPDANFWSRASLLDAKVKELMFEYSSHSIRRVAGEIVS